LIHGLQRSLILTDLKVVKINQLILIIDGPDSSANLNKFLLTKFIREFTLLIRGQTSEKSVVLSFLNQPMTVRKQVA